MAAGLLLAIVAVMMLEQSARWALTAAARGAFVRDRFLIENLQDRGGEGGFSYYGRVASTGEQFHSDTTIMVPLTRLRELEAAGAIPGAREPVWYLPAAGRLAGWDPVVRFRVQSQESFAADASVWTIVNVLIAVAAVWLIRASVRAVRRRPA